MEKNSENIKHKSVAREYAEAILVALLLALFIRTFVVQAFKIPSGSMIPTLLIGDHILVNKFSYGIKNPFTGEVWFAVGDPQPHDIIVFKYPQNPSQDFIKRVIAVGGQQVAIKNKKVYVDGVEFVEPHAVFQDPFIGSGPRDNMEAVEVPPGKLFVMGDNRDNSHDSRFWGFVGLDAVKGKAFMLYWSWDSKDGDFPVRLNRIGKFIE